MKFFVSNSEAAFLYKALEANSSIAKKYALQRLCKVYREGGRFRNDHSVKGLIFVSLNDPDEKVRRWAFNALAQLGSIDDLNIMLGPWEANRDFNDVFEAGLTALARILPKEKLMPVLKKSRVELDSPTLLALGQQTNSFSKELNSLHLDIFKASAKELRSATLLIGLRRAPDSLFSGKHPVSAVIGDLNTHDDPIIAQYSFWATAEHPDLGLNNTKVSPKKFSTLPPNVQGWAYQVLTKRSADACDYYDSIIEGSESQYSIVREGLAKGLRNVFYDSLDSTIMDWFVDEQDSIIRELLLEHMATQVTKSPFYKSEVLSAFRTSSTNSMLRSRLEAASQNDDLSLEFRKIALQTGDPDLFASIVGPHVKNTQNFNGSMSIGGISNSGTGNVGNVQFINNAALEGELVKLLSTLLDKIQSLPQTNELVEGGNVLQNALDKPSKTNLQRVVSFLKLANEGGQSAAALGALGHETYDKLLDLIPRIQHLII